MLKQINIVKIRDVKTPTRAHPTDAGLDFYIPNDWGQKQLAHGESVLIPSGIKMEVPDGYVMIFHNKSGNASKLNIDVLANVVDAQYSGEIHLNVINNGMKSVVLYAGMKLLQGIILKVETPKVIGVKESDLYSGSKTDRGDGGFGSTGRT